MDSKEQFIKQINDFKVKGTKKINDTKNYLVPRLEKGTKKLITIIKACAIKAYAAYQIVEPMMVRFVNASKVKASVAYKEMEPVVIKAAKTVAVGAQEGAMNLVERIESKFGKIHFDFRHFVMTSGVAVVVFALTFTVTGMNRSQVSAAVLETPEVETYNKEVIDVNYGDDSAIVDVVKEILEDDISNVHEAKPVTLAGGKKGYEIDKYVVSVDGSETKELGEEEISLSIQTKDTYEGEDFGKVEIQDSKVDAPKEDGAVHTYTLKVNYVDTQAPEVKLKQSEVELNDVDVFNKDAYVESIVDNYDGTIAGYTIEGEVPEKDELRWEAGEYTLVYKAVDSNGNEGSASLKVKINETEDEEEEEDVALEATKAENSSAPVQNEAPNYANAGSIVAAAYAQLGVYQDCTMLVTNSLKAVGIYHHGWPASYLSLGTVVSATEAQPGDIIYYANGGMGMAHVAVYIGGGQAIHGGWTGNQTVVASAYVGSGPVFIRVR